MGPFCDGEIHSDPSAIELHPIGTLLGLKPTTTVRSLAFVFNLIKCINSFHVVINPQLCTDFSQISSLYRYTCPTWSVDRIFNPHIIHLYDGVAARVDSSGRDLQTVLSLSKHTSCLIYTEGCQKRNDNHPSYVIRARCFTAVYLMAKTE